VTPPSDELKVLEAAAIGAGFWESKFENAWAFVMQLRRIEFSRQPAMILDHKHEVGTVRPDCRTKMPLIHSLLSAWRKSSATSRRLALNEVASATTTQPKSRRRAANATLAVINNSSAISATSAVFSISPSYS
jgi:hypothetical protein